MTHSNHRRGDRESLSKDYIVITRVDRTNQAQIRYKEGLKNRVKKFLEICANHKPIAIASKEDQGILVNRWMKGWIRDMDSGIHKCISMNEITEDPNPNPRAVTHVVYRDYNSVVNVIKELKEADLGLSVVVSGMFDKVFQICEETQTNPHTVNLSLETFGRTDLLPKEPILSLLTMCGHSLISRHLIENLIQKISEDVLSIEEAAVEMGKQCTCNIFNLESGIELIRKYIELKGSND